MFGASAVTDEEFESGQFQPVSPDWYACDSNTDSHTRTVGL